MHYICPECRQDREPHSQVHTILYRETTIVVDAVPGALCPGCGSVSLHPDTQADLDSFLRTRRRLRPRLSFRAR